MLISEPDVVCRSVSNAPGHSLADQHRTKSNSGLSIGGRNFQLADIAGVEVSFSTHDHQPLVKLIFSAEGNAKFIEVQEGKIGEELPIFFDGRLVSCPVLREPILGGEVHILEAFSAEEASALANKIKP